MKNTLAIAMALAFAPITLASEIPDGWYEVGDAGKSSYAITVGPDLGFKGSGLSVTKIENGSGTFGGVGQAITTADYAGKTVRVTAYIRTENVADGYAGLWFRIDKGKDMLVLDNMNDRGVTGTTNWQEYHAVLRVDPNATRMLFGAILTGSGTMYVDEFALEIVPDDTPVTAGHGPSKPKNLGF